MLAYIFFIPLASKVVFLLLAPHLKHMDVNSNLSMEEISCMHKYVCRQANMQLYMQQLCLGTGLPSPHLTFVTQVTNYS